MANGTWTAGAGPDLNFLNPGNWLGGTIASTGGIITIATATGAFTVKRKLA